MRLIYFRLYIGLAWRIQSQYLIRLSEDDLLTYVVPQYIMFSKPSRMQAILAFPVQVELNGYIVL